MVKIKDMKWGLLDKTLKAIIVGGLMYVMYTDHTYEKKFVASGQLTELWSDTSTMITRQNTVAACAGNDASCAYCSNPYSFPYYYCDKTSAVAAYNEFWCEDNIQCAYTDPSYAMVRQTPVDLWAVTYMKQRSARTIDCPAPGVSDAVACNSTAELVQRAGLSCQCVRTRNFFLAGAEAVSINFRHKPIVDEATSSGDLRRLASVPTEIKVLPFVDGRSNPDPVEANFVLVKNYAPGELISFSIDDLLKWSGIASLDDTNYQVKDDYQSTANPTFRITGLSFDVRVVYSGSLAKHATDRPVKASIQIRAIEGWHNVGNDVTADEDAYLDPTSVIRHDSFNTYRRGVHVEITFAGSIGDMDLFFLLTQVAALIVYVTVSTVIVTLVVTTLLGHTSKVYKGAIFEETSVKGCHARKAVEAVIAANTFSSLQGKLGGTQFTTVMAQQLSEAGLQGTEAAVIANYVSAMRKDGISGFVDASSACSHDTVSIADVANNAPMGTKERRASMVHPE